MRLPPEYALQWERNQHFICNDGAWAIPECAPEKFKMMELHVPPFVFSNWHEVNHPDVAIKLRLEYDRTPTLFRMWMNEKCFSPEPFFKIELAPCEVWKLEGKYTFITAKC